jgi:hypothetical protein
MVLAVAVTSASPRVACALPVPSLRPSFCCNGSSFFAVVVMGVAIYLALVGGGLTAAFLAAVVLKGVKLI